ncbi:helix-turn-helix transcriptional regulator [Xanthovirga aplysinae]|uniref:helix-turn-helix transcriptional regulator n=1 Tax=Xanthovirga aplysinae TaxID=2529853 RepID=UPI0012BCFB6C|nr:AraC family transcriptional regulator [Xanthovirga aplysinae]MTI30822.1 AraC family transcriptional regulator [Xanthovirga aplysinae]
MNYLVIWSDFRLFYGSHPRRVTEHSHPVIQLVVAAHGTFLSKDKSGNWINKKGLLIAPNHIHQCDANNIHIISIDINPESSLGEWVLSKQLKNVPIIDYPSKDIVKLDFKIFSELLNNENWEAMRIMIENTFQYQNTFRTSQKEGRIQNILDFISNNIDKNITSEMLMEVAYLSESRLLHLFKEKMGLPISNYILWTRLKIVQEQILKGHSLTHASYKAGFADQAHMTRTFKKMTGVPPSLIAKNSKFVQVSFPH